MNSTTAFRISAGIGFLAVALGAFGAHKLQPLLVQNSTTEIWGKAASYHLIHAVLLVFLATRIEIPAPGRRSMELIAWRFFLAGIVIFSGSLYILAVTGIHRLGAITPIGGVCLLAGWAVLAFKR